MNEAVCLMFTELSLGCWSSGHRNLSMYQVLSSTMFFFVSYMHIHAPFIMYCSSCCFPRNNILLNMPVFVGSQSFISLPSFMFVSAVVSEIRELKKKRRRIIILKLTISNLTPFLGIYLTHFLTRGIYLLSTCTDSTC